MTLREPVRTWMVVRDGAQARISGHQEELRLRVGSAQRDIAHSLVEVFNIETAVRKSGGDISVQQVRKSAGALRRAAETSLIIADIGRAWGPDILDNPAAYEYRAGKYMLDADALVQGTFLETLAQFRSENGRMAFESIRTIMSRSGMDFEDGSQRKEAQRILENLSKDGIVESGYFIRQFRITDKGVQTRPDSKA